mgnify:CR=1 FL=1
MPDPKKKKNGGTKVGNAIRKVVSTVKKITKKKDSPGRRRLDAAKKTRKDANVAKRRKQADGNKAYRNTKKSEKLSKRALKVEKRQEKKNTNGTRSALRSVSKKYDKKISTMREQEGVGRYPNTLINNAARPRGTGSKARTAIKKVFKKKKK